MGSSDRKNELQEIELAGRHAWVLGHCGAWLDDVRPHLAGPPLVRLVPGYDPYLLGYHDRDQVVPLQHAQCIHPGGGLLHPAVLVDDLAIGMWRSTRLRARVVIVVEMFGEIGPGILQGIEAEVADLGRFHGAGATARVTAPADTKANH